MNAIIAFNMLWATRPGLDASDEEVAAWLDAKGRVHERLAEQARTKSEKAERLCNAMDAYEHARRLLVPVSRCPVGAEAVR